MRSLLGRLQGHPGSESQCVRSGLAHFNTHIDLSRLHHGLHPPKYFYTTGKCILTYILLIAASNSSTLETATVRRILEQFSVCVVDTSLLLLLLLLMLLLILHGQFVRNFLLSSAY